MEKRHISFFIIFWSFALVFAQEKDYFNSLVEQLKCADLIGYKQYDFNRQSLEFSQGRLFKAPSNSGPFAFFGIYGKGFYKIRSISTGEEFYTRAGYILCDENWNLLVMPGYELFHNKTKDPIKNIEVLKNGIIRISFFDKDIIEIKLKLYMPAANSSVRIFENRYSFSEVEEVTGEYDFKQGFLEMSNVNKIYILLELQSVLLKLVEQNQISQALYQYNLTLCKELIIIYSGIQYDDFDFSFTNQTIDNLQAADARQIVNRLTLE